MERKQMLLWLAWSVALGLVYAGFQNSLPPAELGAAGVGAVASCAIAVRFAACSPQRFAGRWDWLPIFLTRLPPAIFRESWLLLGPVLWRALRGKNARGRYIALPFDPGGDDAYSASRRVAVIYGASVTPNAIPIFVDRENRFLVLHQLDHRQEPGAGDKEWPV